MFNFFKSRSLSFILLIALCSFAIVRSEYDSSIIKLPTENEEAFVSDPCTVKAEAVKTPASCPVTCFRTDPVCGIDGVTYWCGCAEAICAGTRVAKLGYCEVGSGGSAPFPGGSTMEVKIVTDQNTMKRREKITTCLECLGSFFASMLGGVILIRWQLEYHSRNRHLWMVPFGLIMFVIPVVVWLSILLSDTRNSDQVDHVSSSN